MGNEHTDNGDRCTRRTFLRRGATGSSLVLGFGFGRSDDQTEGAGQQDDELIPRINAVVPRLDILANNYLRKLVVFVGNEERPVPPNLARRCFPDQTPRQLDRHNVVVADWEGVTRLTAENAQEALQHVVPSQAYLRLSVEVSVSAPYVIVGATRCAGDYLNVNAHKLSEAVRGGIGPPIDHKRGVSRDGCRATGDFEPGW